jgi:hypothetical protein
MEENLSMLQGLENQSAPLRVYLPVPAEIMAMHDTRPAVEKVAEMWRLWGEQEQITLGSPEHKALIDHIRLLLAEYDALVEAITKQKQT